MPFYQTIASYVQTRAERFFRNILLPNLSEITKEVRAAARPVPFKYKVTDTWAVLRNSGSYLVFALLAIIIFWALPQGQDLMYILVDSWTDSNKRRFIFYLLFLVIALCGWSLCTEFGSRYAMYVSDNSGHSISSERVTFRKAITKLAAVAYLILPFVIIAGSLCLVCVPQFVMGDTSLMMPFSVVLVVLYLAFSQLTGRYFNSDGKKGFWYLPKEEVLYVDKLYGIYKDYTYILPAETTFERNVSGNYERFAENFTNTQQFGPSFPQSSAVNPEQRIPVEGVGSDGRKRPGFKLLAFRYPGVPKDYNGDYKWTYRVPLKYYIRLHHQVKIIFFSSLAVYAVICLLSVFRVLKFGTIGSPALVCLAFACWAGIYMGILYMDYGKLRDTRISVRLILVLLFLVSCFAHDHPVRKMCCRQNVPRQRLTLQQHFTNWLGAYKDSLLSNAYYKRSNDSLKKSDSLFYPIVFVCAEGGALRTGAFTSLVLSSIQDSFDKFSGNDAFDFKKSIYAYSGVSGGSVGIGFFNAIANMNRKEDLGGQSYTELSRRFFKKDYLAPLIGRLFYADVINFFSPIYIPLFDRASALETSWEVGYRSLLQDNGSNVFAQSFTNTYNHRPAPAMPYPALFINTTEIEDGLQCWITNVDAANSHMPQARQRDLLSKKIDFDFNYSTAINFSTRFPIFSPSGSVGVDGSGVFHYVDGGYVENTGAATMIDILLALEPLLAPGRVQNRVMDPHIDSNQQIFFKPYVIMLRFGETGALKGKNADGMRTMLSDIVSGIYSTRFGRSLVAMEQLDSLVHRLHGEYIDLPLPNTAKEVPMNWILSKRSYDALDSTVHRFWYPVTKQEYEINARLRKLFQLDSTCKRCVHCVCPPIPR